MQLPERGAWGVDGPTLGWYHRWRVLVFLSIFTVQTETSRLENGVNFGLEFQLSNGSLGFVNCVVQIDRVSGDAFRI